MPSDLAFFGAMVSAVFGLAASFERAKYKSALRALVLLGAILSAIGAFWASARQEKFNIDRLQYERELRSKSEEISELHKRIVAEITGGEGFCYVHFIGDREKGDFILLLSNPVSILFMTLV
jgi:hypothetical protein